MEVRSYYSTTVEAAMELARKELGSEAMLIQSERTSPELAHLGRYQVVFAGELAPPRETVRPAVPKSPLPPSTPKQAALQQSSPRPAFLSHLSKTNVSRASTPLRPRMEVVPGLGPIDLVSNPTEGDFASVLESAGVDRETSKKFFDGLQLSRNDVSREQPVENDRDTAREIACSPSLGRPGSSNAMVALVGPPGAGKTSTIMKLAVQRGLRARLNVRLFALDPHRVCATSQLRDFAALLGIDFAAFDSLEDAGDVLEQSFHGLTLIDTPGYSRSEAAALSDLAAFLRTTRQIDTHLVLRADRKTSDNLESMTRFSHCGPSRFILTALDDTADHADLRNLLERSAVPLSFLGIGPRIPEDLEPARTKRVTDLIWRGWTGAARAAA